MTQAEKNKNIPLYLFASAPAALAPCFPLARHAGELPAHKDDLYFLVFHAEPELAKAALNELHAAGVSPERIILSAEAERPLPFAHDPIMGVLELLPDDSAEEIRQRLQLRIETQRHRQLPAAIEAARLVGTPSDLSAEEWLLRLETAHLTHAFCCSLDLALSRHQACLTAALTQTEEKSAAWAGNLPLEKLLPLCARLALRHCQTPTAFREEFRSLAACLPFRTRTDLRNVVERCLESIWKGISHVA